MQPSSYFRYFLILFSYSIHAQVPCVEEQHDIFNIALNGEVSQSSTVGEGIPNIAIDGQKNGAWNTGGASRTEREYQAWWEINLGQIYALENIQIWYPADIYPEGISDYYILYSRYPFGSTNLATELTSSLVGYIHVAGTHSSGATFPLAYQSAKYLRIQKAEDGVLSFLEIDIPGSFPEVCDNGCDDDRDGLTDCEDDDCQPHLFNIEKVDPTCPICPDGQISIQAFGEDLRFSVDGGQSFETACDALYLCRIDGLIGGDYEVVVSNGAGCSVTWPDNPVQLQAPPGQPRGDCVNGGFEEGTWTNWTGLVSTVVKEEVELRFHSDRHFIKSQGTDPIVPEIILPFSGSYTAQLNAPISGGWQIGSRYCFVVDDSNQDFVFNYTMILQDPDAIEGERTHTVEEKPFFSYEMYFIENGEKELIPNGSMKVIADRNNDFFKSVEHEQYQGLVYRNWTCEYIDLSAYLGIEVCIDFIASDCALGEHFGYAYVDGLCEKDFEPILNFEVNTNYCENQNIVIDPLGSSGFDNYTWKICMLDESGYPEFCAEENIIDFEITALDVKQFICDHGGTLDCGTPLSIALTVENNCSDPVTLERKINYICAEYDFTYKNIFLCGRNTNIDVMIEGENNCPTCTYMWNPSLGLNADNIAFPTIQGSLNTQALNQNYQVTASTEEGCDYVEEINIYKLPVIEFEVRDDYSFCGRKLFVNLYYEQSVERDWVAVEFKNLTTGISLNSEIVAINDIGKWYRYELVDIVDPQINPLIEARVGWAVSAEENTVVELGGDCSVFERYELSPNNLFQGIPVENMKMINTFLPDEEVNNTFKPIVNPDAINGSNVYWAKMEIYNNFGNKVHDVEAFSTSAVPPHIGYNSPLDMDKIEWDGNDNQGNPYASAVYIYKIWLANCTYPDATLEGNPDNCCHFSGNVTLVR